MSNTESQVRCGIVLAAGEGKRLRPFVRRLRGDSLPKQYVDLIGAGSMLEQTFDRAERLIPPDRLFTVINEAHLRFPEASEQISSRPQETVVLQPGNKETGPGLLLPLTRLHKFYPEAVVAIFPSDQFILEEERFMGYVDLACRFVEEDPSRLVLLGVDPQDPESEYGYIEPGEPARNLTPSGIFHISRFIEKPGPEAAYESILRGGLWNTMVMAFKAKTFLDLVCKMTPEYSAPFHQIWKAVGTPGEAERVREVYRGLAPMNLSSGLLAPLSTQKASGLAALRAQGIFWSDWGSERRIVDTLEKLGCSKPLQGTPEKRPDKMELALG